jgi:hypothetical protein
MQDKELYQYILGLQSPWSVSEVKLHVENQRIDVHVEHMGEAAKRRRSPAEAPRYSREARP